MLMPDDSQTVQTLIRCHILRHLILVYIVCQVMSVLIIRIITEDLPFKSEKCFLFQKQTTNHATYGHHDVKQYTVYWGPPQGGKNTGKT